MKDRRKVSTIIRAAANNRLWDGISPPEGKFTMSCLAVFREERESSRAGDWLMNEMEAHMPHEIPIGHERQAFRYAWLMFAADLADEWNIQ